MMAAFIVICSILAIAFCQAVLSQGTMQYIVMNAREAGLSPIHILSQSQTARERLCLAVDYQLFSVPSKNPCQLICMSRMSAMYPMTTRRYNVDDGAICGVNQICIEGSCVHDPSVFTSTTMRDTTYQETRLPSSPSLPKITLTRPTLTTITPTQTTEGLTRVTKQPELTSTTPYAEVHPPAVQSITIQKITTALQQDDFTTMQETTHAGTTTNRVTLPSTSASTSSHSTAATSTTPLSTLPSTPPSTTTTTLPPSTVPLPPSSAKPKPKPKPEFATDGPIFSDTNPPPHPLEGSIPTPNIEDLFFF